MIQKHTLHRCSGPTRRGGSAAASVGYEDWLIERLKDPRDAAEYLEAAIDEAAQAVLKLALRLMANTQFGVAEVDRPARLTRSRAP